MRFIKLHKILQKAKLIYITPLLLIIGAACIASTVYQEQIEEPDLDDYHMGIPSGIYVWKSHNPLASSFGIACLIFGAILTVGLLLMHRRKISAEKRKDDNGEAEAEE